MAFWSRKTEQRSIPAPENQAPLSVYPSSSIWPYRALTPTASLAIADVWSAVRVLADAASSLPLHVYRRGGESRQRVTSGKLVDLLERPGPGSSQADLISSLMAHVLVHGNSYLAKYREDGEVTQLGLLDPERIRPELENGVLRYRYTPGNGPQRMLTASDVVHVKGLSVDGLVGLSAVTQASRVLGLSDELVKHALAYFDNGEFQRPAGILRVGVGSEFASTDEGNERKKERVRADSKPHGVLVLEGDAEYTQISSPLDSAQFHQQRTLAAAEVARVFRIPAHMIGAPTGDSLTYATVEQQSLDFVRFSLQPWLRRIELAISNDGDLAFQQQFVKFEVDGLLRADANTRSQVYARALDPISGWLDVDEVRALEDLPPRPAAPTLPIGNNGNGTPLVVPVEGRSHDDKRDDALADAIQTLASKPAAPPPVVNVDVRGATKRTVTFSDGRQATVEDDELENTTNGNVEAISE